MAYFPTHWTLSEEKHRGTGLVLENRYNLLVNLDTHRAQLTLRKHFQELTQPLDNMHATQSTDFRYALLSLYLCIAMPQANMV